MATILENEAAWSTTAATNANVDTGINWAEGQDAASVNNSARGMMAARRKATLDLCGGLTAGGTANALTVTTNQVLSTAHITDGCRLLVYAGLTNTSATVTFAPDGLTAAPIKRADGSALMIGSIKAGMRLDLAYISGASEWRALNIPPTTISNANLVSFLIDNNNVDFATTATPLLLVFTTVRTNNGGYYVTNYWGPPAGTISLHASVTWSAPAGNMFVYVYKNGVNYKFAGGSSASGLTTTISVSFIDVVNGADFFQLYASSTLAAMASGSTGATYYCGALL